MRFGYYASVQDAPILKELGYDYLECTLRDLDGISQEQLREARAMLDGTGLAAETCSGFYDSQRIMGPQATPAGELADYASRVLERAAELGCRVAAYSNSRARYIPAGFSRERAREQFCQAAWQAAEIAGRFGIVLALEPLCSSESNFVNTLEEGLELIQEVGHRNLFLMADWYHVCREQEPFSHVVQAGPLLRHVHLAECTGRRSPRLEDGTDYPAISQALSQAGYQGRITIEAVSDPARPFAREAEEGMRVLDRYFRPCGR